MRLHICRKMWCSVSWHNGKNEAVEFSYSPCVCSIYTYIYIYIGNYFQPFSFSYVTFVFHHTLRDILGHTKNYKVSTIAPNPKKHPPQNPTPSPGHCFSSRFRWVWTCTPAAAARSKGAPEIHILAGFCLGNFGSQKPFSGRTWGVVLKVQQFLFDVNVCLHLEIRHTIQGIVEETWMGWRGEWRWNSHPWLSHKERMWLQNGSYILGGQEAKFKNWIPNMSKPMSSSSTNMIPISSWAWPGSWQNCTCPFTITSWCPMASDIAGLHLKLSHEKIIWNGHHNLSCHVMLCFTLLTSQCSPNRLNPAHPLRLLHLRAISTPRHLQGLKGTTKWPPQIWPPWNQISETKPEKTSKRYGFKWLFNLQICDCFMPQFQNSTEFSKRLRPAQVGTFKVRTYSTSMSLRSCRSLESYWNQPAK